MDPRPPIPFNDPDALLAELRAAQRLREQHRHFYFLLAVMSFAALVFAGGFALVLFLAR